MQVLTPADDVHHINKHNFKVPFVCGCRDLGEALRRIAEGAAMIRTKVSPAPADTLGGLCWAVLCSALRLERPEPCFSPGPRRGRAWATLWKPV